MFRLIGIRFTTIIRLRPLFSILLFIPLLMSIVCILAFIYSLVALFSSDEPWFGDYYSSQKYNILLKNNFINSKLLKYKIPENKGVNYTYEKQIDIKYFFEDNEINKNYFGNKEINQNEKSNLKTNYSNLSNYKNFFNKKIFSDKASERKNNNNIFEDYIYSSLIAAEFNIIILILLNIIKEEKSKQLDIYLQLKNISKIKFFFPPF